MTALVVCNLQWLLYGPAHTAQGIVIWYAARLWTLWVLLIALPFAGLVIGCAELLWSWNNDVELRQAARHPPLVIRTHLTTLFVVVETLATGVFLAVSVMHMLMN